MDFLISSAYAQDAAAQPGGLMQFLPLILIFAVFYFLLIRPQMKRAKEHRNLVAALGKGDEPVSNIDFWFCPRAEGTPNSFISYYGPDSKYRQFHKYLGMIQAPVLVIAGSADERFPNIPEQIGPMVDNERLFLSVIEDAGHFFRDLNIEDAMETMIEFIEDTG